MDTLDSIEELRLKANTLESQTDELLCRLKEENRPIRYTTPSRESMMRELEATLLQPPTTFENAWLNRLQQQVLLKDEFS